MDFNDHSEIGDRHAFLSPSYYHWINYDLQKLEARWTAAKASAHGTRLHLYAKAAIELGMKQPKAKKTVNLYVNDAIGYKMTPEQPLFYSENAFGTVDAISFRRKVLRIHDLKTGITKSSFRQLEVYAAYFCLEYGIDPYDITIELRIYQSDTIRRMDGDPEMISTIMDKTVEFDHYIETLKAEEGKL